MLSRKFQGLVHVVTRNQNRVEGAGKKEEANTLYKGTQYGL